MDNRPKVFPTAEQIAAANQTGEEIARQQEQTIASGQVSLGEAEAALAKARDDENVADRERGFRRHAYQPGQPVALHVLLSHHFPGMHKNGAT